MSQRKQAQPAVTILVIDDEADIGILIQELLQPEGYRILTVRDGEQGIARNRDIDPDLIILDLKMPKMGGIETLKIIRKTDPEVRVVILTGYGDIQSVREALALGVCEYVAKPFEGQTLRRVVKEALASRSAIGHE